MSFNSAKRAATGRGAGDEIEVRLELNDAPRTVDVPEAPRPALAADAGASVAWDALSLCTQKAHARSVSDAKTEDTRQRRLDKPIETLRG